MPESTLQAPADAVEPAARPGRTRLSPFPPKPGVFVLHTEQTVARPIEEVFAFFSDAANLQTITPPWLHFRVLTPQPIEMGVGTMIDYKLRLRVVPLRWRSEITAWEPPYRFVDEQRRGPYRLWVHEHTFEPCDGGTLVRDIVHYAAPGGGLINRFLVRPDLQRIFAYRKGALEDIFGSPSLTLPANERPPSSL
jgi:ligand-binding SRPBCC domain-containing protein